MFSMMMSMSLLSVNTAMAAIDVYEFDTPQQEAQYRGLIAEFRCPKCQNQNLAGSDAPIAQDLKQKTYEMVKAGQSDAQIREYMYDRYGDFISYKPPVRPSTWILWFFPPLLLLLLVMGWVWRTKRQSKLAVVAPSTTQHKQMPADNAHQNTDAEQIERDHNTEQSQVASKLTVEEQKALAALLAAHDTPDKGDK
ncbi:cytochrome c-type biogenesis protein [Psychrobacter sp. I-STPA10]|uniref:cytochrome c-type biogenesis protein n=1 Tax=Psychrobacter sp. I-STPA10 TaxID=2585769 RepID=UPI001E5B0E96|nr:cytochrome c-type biogenesis protein [Psychrobacter sp. I-STPA10]